MTSDKNHIHSFTFAKLDDGSVKRTCACGATTVEMAAGKLTPEPKSEAKRPKSSYKKKTEAQPLF